MSPPGLDDPTLRPSIHSIACSTEEQNHAVYNISQSPIIEAIELDELKSAEKKESLNFDLGKAQVAQPRGQARSQNASEPRNPASPALPVENDNPELLDQAEYNHLLSKGDSSDNETTMAEQKIQTCTQGIPKKDQLKSKIQIDAGPAEDIEEDHCPKAHHKLNAQVGKKVQHMYNVEKEQAIDRDQRMQNKLEAAPKTKKKRIIASKKCNEDKENIPPTNLQNHGAKDGKVDKPQKEGFKRKKRNDTKEHLCGQQPEVKCAQKGKLRKLSKKQIEKGESKIPAKAAQRKRNKECQKKSIAAHEETPKWIIDQTEKKVNLHSNFMSGKV